MGDAGAGAVVCPVLSSVLHHGGEDRSISKQAALERAELLHSRTIGVSDDFREAERKKKALQEEEERKARVAKRKARSFLGKDSRAASRAESRRDDHRSVVSVPAFSPEEQTAPVEDAYDSEVEEVADADKASVLHADDGSAADADAHAEAEDGSDGETEEEEIVMAEADADLDFSAVAVATAAAAVAAVGPEEEKEEEEEEEKEVPDSDSEEELIAMGNVVAALAQHEAPDDAAAPSVAAVVAEQSTEVESHAVPAVALAGQGENVPCTDDVAERVETTEATARAIASEAMDEAKARGQEPEPEPELELEPEPEPEPEQLVDAEAAKLERERLVAEEAQQQMLADPTFGELAGLLDGFGGGLSVSSSSSSSEVEDDEQVEVLSSEDTVEPEPGPEQPETHVEEEQEVVEDMSAELAKTVAVTCPEGSAHTF
jgi:hypothetical protein